MAFACSAMRVVAEVDVDLGLTRVVWVGTAQDVGRALNPQAVHGQIEGGTAQGLGLALMEEIQTKDGLITNASFTDYLIPTALDMPPVWTELVEDPEPDAPYGVKGVGEPPTVVSTAAIVAALRDATGRELVRAPVRPDEIVGLAMSDFTHTNLMEIEDSAVKFGFSPALESRFARGALETERVGLSYQRIAPDTRAPFGHHHRSAGGDLRDPGRRRPREARRRDRRAEPARCAPRRARRSRAPSRPAPRGSSSSRSARATGGLAGRRGRARLVGRRTSSHTLGTPRHRHARLPSLRSKAGGGRGCP